MDDGRLAALFINDACIQSLRGVAKGVAPAHRASPEPVLQKDQPWEQKWHLGSYVNLIHDSEDGLFKRWYGGGK